MQNPVLRVAFVAVIAILAMLYMASLLNKAPSYSLTSTGAAYTSPSQSYTSEYPTLEQQQNRLAQVIAEPDPAKKAAMAQQMSRFTVWDSGDHNIQTPPQTLVNPGALE
ncbi:MAG: hypothetical protein AABX70_00720 [Nanoarchaeota archaeon]